MFEIEIPITNEQAHVFEKLARVEISRWNLEVNKCKVNHQNVDPNIVVAGDEPTVLRVEQDVKKILGSIVSCSDISVKTPGALSVSESDAVLTRMSSRRAAIQPDKTKSPAYCKFFPNVETFDIEQRLKVKVQQGLVSVAKVDVIVCPTYPNLEMGGEVGDEVLQAGGQSILDECMKHFKQSGGPVMYGKFYQSKPGKLACSSILHAVGPKERDPSDDAIMKCLLKGCINKAHDLKVASIALPLAFNYTSGKLAEELWTIASEFVKNNKDTNLKEIQIVDTNARRLYECTQKLRSKANPGQPTAPATAAAASVSGTSRSFIYDDSSKTLSTREGIAIALFVGSVCDVTPPVDTIVNSAASDLNLNTGKLSNDISTRGGEKMQKEVKVNLAKKPGGVTTGELVNSESYEITCCKLVHHCVLEKWDEKPDGSSLKALRKAISGALESTHSIRFGSIAFPAIGGGILETPLNVVFDVLMEEVNAFSAKHPQTSLKRVVLVAYDKDDTAVKLFTGMYEHLVKDATKVAPRWTYTFPPQNYELFLTLHTLSAASLDDIQDELNTLFNESVKSDLIHRRNQQCLDQINDDKAKALQCLQYTYRVRITLQKSSDKLDSILIEGFVDDVKQAKQDALSILAQ